MAIKETNLWTIEKELWVENRLGLHARPVAKSPLRRSNSTPTSPWRKTAW